MRGKIKYFLNNDPNLREIEMGDAYKTASVVAKAISKCQNALDGLLHENPSEMQNFYNELKTIEKDFKMEFQAITQGKRLLN